MRKERLVCVTWNVWGHESNWLSRVNQLCQVLGILTPDILLLQEVNEELLGILDGFLRTRGLLRVSGQEPGWTCESGIYYSSSMFSLVVCGLETDLKMQGAYFQHRGLFWARLKFTSSEIVDGPCVVVSTAHLPWVGSEEEVSSGVNQRIACSHAINNHLERIHMDNDVLTIFGGDLNEDFHPVRILTSCSSESGLGLREVFSELDQPPPITHPVRPSDPFEEARPDRCLDWLLYKAQNPAICRPLCAMAKRIKGGYPPASDHLPVCAVLELTF